LRKSCWRKLVGVEPTRDTKCRTTGFEDQAQHRLSIIPVEIVRA
jgi:hypothetical protein